MRIEKRLKKVYIAVLVLMLALSGRFAYIQILGHEDLSAAALKQHSVALAGINDRGVIYDRNMKAITGTSKEYVYIVEKSHRDSMLPGILHAGHGIQRSTNDRIYDVFSFASFDKAIDSAMQNKYDAFAIENTRRYDDEQSAVHLIGYTNPMDGNGAAGLEEAYDYKLSHGSGGLYVETDARGRILQGAGLRSKSTVSDVDAGSDFGADNVEAADSEASTADLVTTLDLDLQSAVEKILKERAICGCAVVMDTESGGILAAAGTPIFDPNRVKDYLGGGDALVNKVTQGEYPPGSIFKIAVMAAALEYGAADEQGMPVTPDTQFECDGSIDLYGVKIGCASGGEEGHGKITLRSAFAKSCNCAFIRLGQLTGAKNILKMSENLGLGRSSLSDIKDVKQGNVTKLDQTAGAGIGNLSIGQGEMLTTPLQITVMTNTIAAGGIRREASLLLGKEDKKGKRVMSLKTSEIITDLMGDVMEYGTGSNMRSQANVCGKTGSAEAFSGSKSMVHGWFTGFFPANDPKYTITVFVENGRSGRTSAVPAAGDIVKAILNKT